MIEAVDSPNFGINFDTGNFLRLLDDPVAGMEKLAPYVFSTHLKDLKMHPTAKPTDWYFFCGVPVGMGLVDNDKLAELLSKAGYKGFLAVEIDCPAPEWMNMEKEAIAVSVYNLKKIGKKVRVSVSGRGGKLYEEDAECSDDRRRVHGQGPFNAWLKVNTFFDAPYKVNLKVIVGNHTPLEEFAERWGYDEVSYDWREVMKREDIDIVDIGTPTYMHHDMVIEAAKNGKHIVCEKPCAMNYRECCEMVEAVEKAGVVHYLNHNYRRVPPCAGKEAH